MLEMGKDTLIWGVFTQSKYLDDEVSGMKSLQPITSSPCREPTRSAGYLYPPGGLLHLVFFCIW